MLKAAAIAGGALATTSLATTSLAASATEHAERRFRDNPVQPNRNSPGL